MYEHGASVSGGYQTSSDTETQLSYFEVLDFALQIARGMEHLERIESKSKYCFMTMLINWCVVGTMLLIIGEICC